MIELGADVNAETTMTHRNGQVTPLQLAMAGAAFDADMRRTPATRRADWTRDDAREQERRTRGRGTATRGPGEYVAVARLLLSANADVNAGDSVMSPLGSAAWSGNVELIALFIEAGADVNAGYRGNGREVRTPLVDAVALGDVAIVRRLLDAGAKVDRSPKRVLVNYAMNEPDVLRLLLDRGLDLPANALTIAANGYRLAAAVEIVNRGYKADVDAALVAAVNDTRDGLSDEQRNRLLRFVRLMLDNGAMPNAPDGSGEALVAAIERDYDAVVALLKERGATVDWTRLTDRDHRPQMLAYGTMFSRRIDRLRAFEALGMPLDAWGASILGRADRLRAIAATRPAVATGGEGEHALYFASAYGNVDCAHPPRRRRGPERADAELGHARHRPAAARWRGRGRARGRRPPAVGPRGGSGEKDPRCCRARPADAGDRGDARAAVSRQTVAARRNVSAKQALRRRARRQFRMSPNRLRGVATRSVSIRCSQTGRKSSARSA